MNKPWLAPYGQEQECSVKTAEPQIYRLMAPEPPGLQVNDDPQDWREAFAERAAIRKFDGLYPRAVAEALAFGELVNQWHFQNAVVQPGQCAGCGHPAEGDDVIRLADGADVHLGCVRAYGLKWRRTASEALVEMGLTIPAGWSL